MRATGEYRPRLVFWEVTKGCNLRCVHCRATATELSSPRDLPTAQALGIIDQIAEFASPILVLSGGEPLYRKDIFELAGHASARGLRVALATNGTLVTPEVARRVVESGIKRVSISLDGATAATHDAFRQIPGAFDAALRGFRYLKAQGMSVQINMTIARHNAAELPRVLEMVRQIGADALHTFLLVPVGCGANLAETQMVDPVEYEKILNWFYEQAAVGDIELKATCAPHYFRVVRQRRVAEKHDAEEPAAPQLATAHGHPGGMNAMTKGCLAGTGVCFVSFEGEVFPCGYLPAVAGDLRHQSFAEVWTQSPVFADLRDTSKLEGKCGRCEYRGVCMGCRARAYAASGNYMAEEPFCIYQPQTAD